MAGVVQEQNLEKQMGCMAGFLQIFDKTQILDGKRLYSTKHLPPSTAVDPCSQPEKSAAVFGEFEKPPNAILVPSLEHFKQVQSPVKEFRSLALETPSKSPLPLPVFEVKEGNKTSWKSNGLLRNQTENGRAVDLKEYNAIRNARAEPASTPYRGIGQRKSFFDSADFFPEPRCQ